MCGYICGTKQTLQAADIEKLLLQQVHRGTDGYGVIALYPDGSSRGFKSMQSAPVLTWVDELVDNPFVFVHHRATSVGGTKLQLTHPLSYEKTLLMQNGTNRNPYEMVEDAESDSEALCMLANYMEPDSLAMYILTEVGVVIFRKDKKFYLHKDASRPLNQHTNGLLSSEPLIAGTWKSVKDGFYPIKFDEGALVGLDYIKPVAIQGVGEARWCGTCKTKHLVQLGGKVCNVCLVNGQTQLKDYSFRSEEDDEEYYDTVFGARGVEGKGWSNPGNAKKQISVLTLLPARSPAMADVRVEQGIPINVNGDFYLVPGVSETGVASYFVVEESHNIDDCCMFMKGWIPKSDIDPLPLTPFDFTPYWNDEEECYDLFKNTYYLDPSGLYKDDMDILVFDKYMDSYIVPMEYNYIASSYARNSTKC